MDGGDKVVYSAGNSWIICRSKSYSGRIYYFNTLTGEAAWNLSDAEIEKAKQRTKCFQNKLNIQECPEPREPPIDQTDDRTPDLQQPSTSRVYNKQIINNKITKQSYPFPIVVPPYNVVANPIMPFAVNSTPAYNPNVWAVPQTHQLLQLSYPTVAPLVNQSQPTPVNIAFNNEEPTITIQNTSGTLSRRFQNLRNTKFQGTSQGGWGRYQRPNFTPNRENYGFRQHNDQYQNNFNKNTGVQDLRKVLSAKKQRRRSCDAECQTETVFEEDTFAANTNTDQWSGYHLENAGDNFEYEEDAEKVGPNDADSDWLEENIRVEDGRLKLDISNLKKMRKPFMDPERWYIVADKDVLLNHLNFLNNLCSDDDCLLMVAQQVMAELHELSRDESSPRTAARARRAACFLQQQLDAGYVYIGDGTCGENDTRCDYLLNCCSNLYEQHYHVVLLSNDDDFETYKNITNIPIFNIQELKQFLTKAMPEHQPDRPKTSHKYKTPEIPKTDRLKPPPCLTKLQSKAPIKITVRNDFVKQTGDKKNTCKITTGTQFNSDVERTETVPDETEHTTYVNNSISPVKYTIEAGVQTDTPADDMSDNVFIHPQINLIESYEKTPEDEKDINNFTTPHLSRKQIRLNRSVSAVSSEDTSTAGEKKHFKWRRKRHASCTAYESKLSSATSSNADENSRDSVSIQKADKVCTSCEQRLPQNKDESLSSEASSFLITRNLTNGTLIVEETSTSGIISNSTSNAESENEGANITKLKKSHSQKSVMYEVIDEKMEDSLRTMNDEWVSRFIQIMEEVLTQILRKDEYFLKNIVYELHGGGPWNITEAADCIKRKFCNNSEIVDAAGKLNEIYMKLSDTTGRITTNLQPSEFMELYSFGKYLIESMLSVFTCEDLECAEQSLQSLLADIQNPNFDASHNETFDNHLQDRDFTTNEQNDEQNVATASEQSPRISANPAEYRTPIKRVIRRSERFTQQNSPGILKRVEDVTQSPGKGPLARSQEVTQSNSPGNGSLRKAGDVTRSHSPGQSSIRRPQEVSQSNSSGQGSLRKPQEVSQNISPGSGSLRRVRDVQSHSPVKDALTRSQVASQSNSPGNGSLRRVEEVTQFISPGKDSLTISLEIPQLNSSGEGSLKICEEVIQSPSPGQGSLRRAEEVNKSISPGKGAYSLRPRNKSCSQNSGNKKDIKFIRKMDIKHNFFTSLNLQKKSVEDVAQPTDSSCPLKLGSKEPVVTSTSQDLIRSIFYRNMDENSQGPKDITITEAKVIRKFTVFPEFEKKIEKPVERQPLDMDQLDYSAPFEEDDNFMNEEYYSDDEEYYENEIEQNDVKVDHYKADARKISKENVQNICEEDMRNLYEEEMTVIRAAPNVRFRHDDDKFMCDSPLSMNNNLHTIFDTIVRRVRNALLNVQTYCVNAQKELNNRSQKHSIKVKYEMNENAEKAQDRLDNLIKSLQSIFYRETYEPERNIQSLLKDNGINDFDLNDNQLKDYRDAIGQCLEQAQILQDTVRLLITVIKKKPIE